MENKTGLQTPENNLEPPLLENVQEVHHQEEEEADHQEVTEEVDLLIEEVDGLLFPNLLDLVQRKKEMIVPHSLLVIFQTITEMEKLKNSLKNLEK